MSDVIKVPRLEALGREELILLIRRRLILGVNDHDILLAAWEAACNRAHTAWDVVFRSYDQSKLLAEAVDRARTPNGKVKAFAAYRAADCERLKLERRAERFQARADALYKQMELSR